MILAPLRGVTIRCFRKTFAEEIRAAGFSEAITPFIAALPGYDPLRDRELGPGKEDLGIRVTPQFIGKDPEALRACLEKVKAAGYETADLNCGCPYPMVRNKGRGSGLLRTPDVLRRMLEVGCAVMGPDKFSVKARLGVERNDELLKLLPMINSFPLRFLTVHARTARQMYGGHCDVEMAEKIEKASKVPVVRNGDIPLSCGTGANVMIGRSFICDLGTRDDIGALLDRYVEASAAELYGEQPVIGRLKELISYWRFLPAWHRRWPVLKLARSLSELRIW